MSEDLADRTALIHLRKQPRHYKFRRWDEGDLLDHVEANREFYLQAIYSLIATWVDAGMPSGKNIAGFRFREFERAVQWILENSFSERMRLFSPNYDETKRRLADPDYDSIRNLLRAALEQGHPQPLSASDLAEIGLGRELLEGSVEQARIQVGKMLGRYFGDKSVSTIGEFTVSREEQNSNATGYKPLKFYRISRDEPARRLRVPHLMKN